MSETNVRGILPFLCAVAIGCSSPAGLRGPDAAVAAFTDAPADTGVDTEPVFFEGEPCEREVRTLSYDLDSWPRLEALAASDRTSEPVMQVVELASSPVGLALGADGNWLFVAQSGVTHGQLGVFRRESSGVVLSHSYSLPEGENPFGLSLSKDGALIAVSTNNTVAFFDYGKTIANAADALIASVAHGADHHTAIDVVLSPDSAFAYVALEYDRAVAVIDIVNEVHVGNIPLAGHAATGLAMSSDGTRLYATVQKSDEFAAENEHPMKDQIIGAIFVIDSVQARMDPENAVMGHAFAGRAPVRAELSSDDSLLWITARGSNALLAFDTTTLLSRECDPTRAIVAVGPAPVGLGRLGSNRIALTNSNRHEAPSEDQTIMIVETDRALAGLQSVTASISVGAFPREVEADPNLIVVSNYNSKSLSVIDVAAINR